MATYGDNDDTYYDAAADGNADGAKREMFSRSLCNIFVNWISPPTPENVVAVLLSSVQVLSWLSRPPGMRLSYKRAMITELSKQRQCTNWPKESNTSCKLFDTLHRTHPRKGKAEKRDTQLLPYMLQWNGTDYWHAPKITCQKTCVWGVMGPLTVSTPSLLYSPPSEYLDVVMFRRKNISVLFVSSKGESDPSVSKTFIPFIEASF